MSHAATGSTDAQTTPGTPPQFTHRQIMTVLIGLMLGMFLAALDQTIVSSSIYTIANDLQGLSLQAWATTAYLITSTVSTPLYGKLSDIFGRRPLYLIAISIFLIGSIYAGFVNSMAELAVARAIQGLGAGGLMSLGLAILGDMVPLKERGRYQGYFMSVFGISSVLGPVIGGFFAGSSQILGIQGWRWVFLINVPIALAALTVVWFFLKIPHQRVDTKIDYWGAATITIGLVPLLIVAEQGREWGWTSANAWLCYLVGVTGIIAFLIAEKRAGDSALIPLRFFKIPAFGISALLNFIIGIGMFGAIAMIPLYLQMVKGLTPTQAGLLMLTFMVGIMAASIISGRQISRTGRYWSFPVIGTFLLTVSALTMSLSLTADTELWVPGLISVFFGAGLGCCMQPLTLSMQFAVPPKDMGVATSTAAFFRSMGGAVGTAVFISMLFALAEEKIQTLSEEAAKDPDYMALFNDPAIVTNPDNKRFLEYVQNNQGAGRSPDLNDTSWLQNSDPELTRPIREGFAQSIDAVMLAAAIIVGIAFIVSFFMPRKKLTDPKEAAEVTSLTEETGSDNIEIAADTKAVAELADDATAEPRKKVDDA